MPRYTFHREVTYEVEVFADSDEEAWRLVECLPYAAWQKVIRDEIDNEFEVEEE